MKVEEPALALDAVERRVPSDRLAYIRHSPGDEVVEAASDVALPVRHRFDVGLHGLVAVGFRDLGVAACEQGGFHGLFRGRSLRHDALKPTRRAVIPAEAGIQGFPRSPGAL